jgi:hypothetical protein
MSTKVFDHAYSIAFTLRSHDPTGAAVSPAEFRKAILKRLASLDDVELIEAIDLPFDTYVVDDEEVHS